ncbi:cytochrome p450, partial [Trifolium pratense]
MDHDQEQKAWISWDNVCKSKEDGGLGVKNLELFNLALCAKWKWRCLVDSSASWEPLLRF